MVGAARGAGLDVLAETCTHYLIYTDEMLHRPDGIKWILFAAPTGRARPGSTLAGGARWPFGASDV